MTKGLIILDGVKGLIVKYMVGLGLLPNIGTLILNGKFCFQAINTNSETATTTGLSTIHSGTRNDVGLPDQYIGLGKQPLTAAFLEAAKIEATRIMSPNPILYAHFPLSTSVLYIGGGNEDILTDHLTRPIIGYYNNSDFNRMQAFRDTHDNADFVSIHLSSPDGTAHHTPGDHMVYNRAYTNAIIQCDTWVGEIMQLSGWHNGGVELWVTTDHGGNASGHGGTSFEERNVFYIHSEKSKALEWIKPIETENAFNPFNYNNVPRLEDIAPTILNAYGIAKPAYMQGNVI